MALEVWYKTVTPRKEVREGRSFNPDEFAIALEQVVAGASGTAPDDYRNPEQFFARTCFTRALKEHSGLVLRRLAGQTANTAPVLTLITQFGGGKTHTLTTLYHLIQNGASAATYPGIPELLKEIGLPAVPAARVAVFVGNAWDPQPGRETPWIDLARQLAGDAGVAALGLSAQTTPPGTDALARVFAAAGGSVLVLMDEVLNFINRHRPLADSFHAFIQNLTVAVAGQTHSAAVISLPRSQTEMSDWDVQWQEKISKVVRRVAKDLLVNDEAEIGEVVRRRLFDDLGDARVRQRVSKAFADWCFERRAQLPPEWTAVDTATSEAQARAFLQSRFEACYPFHPATLSVFQRKWQTLPQYQQTRGTLAMLAQWISWAHKDGYNKARREPLLTLGSAPLDEANFRNVVLGQLGEGKLAVALDFDLAGPQSHARALDVDTQDQLRDIHRRVGSAILFESSGGQADKIAYLADLRFAIGEPGLDTTSIDTAAATLEARAYYVRRSGPDGFRIFHKPTLKKVVSDRRAGLDEDRDILPVLQKLVRDEFERGRTLPIAMFKGDGAALSDSPKLTVVVVDPTLEWGPALRARVAEWTKQRGIADRLYPGALIWCVKKPGRELRDKVETWLAWQRVKRDVESGQLGLDFDPAEISDIATEVREAGIEAKNEVWASYRYLALYDRQEIDGVREIDLGAGHSGSGETLCGRVVSALKTNSLLNESPGAGFLDRKWPEASKASGAWSLLSLRQAFLIGALDRLLDPDDYLRHKLPDFVAHGDFGLASGLQADGTYEHLWFKESLPSEEVTFESDVYLVKKDKAQALKAVKETPPEPQPPTPPGDVHPPPPPDPIQPPPLQTSTPAAQQLRLFGNIPAESWNRVGTKLVPKLRSGANLTVDVDFRLQVSSETSPALIAELRQILDDLGLGDKMRVES